MAKKDPEEELKDLAAKGLIRRPSRSYCEECQEDFGSPLMLLAHIRKVHK